MNKKDMINTINRQIIKAKFKIKKNAPEILLYAGVAGVLVGTVVACKATTKLSTILDDTKVQLVQIKEYAEKEDPKYSFDDSKKDIVIVYTKSGISIFKLYAPALAIGVLSITSILASNNIIKQRNIALAAAYTIIDTSFKEYRSRVSEKYGEEAEHDIRFNVQRTKIEEIVIDENGKEKKVKKTVKVVDLDEASEYARYFDRKTSNDWEKDPSYNFAFLKAQQAYANDKLKAKTKGMLFLNEVYDMLGLDWSKAGQVVGWVYNPDMPHDGDDYIDFRISEVYIQKDESYEKTILLDFNVDGNVWNLMK